MEETQQMKKKKILIGIDPDVDKNGVAYLDCHTRQLEVCTLLFPDLLDYLQWVKRKAEQSGADLTVVVEAGWLNVNNWHLTQGASRAKAASIGNRTGRNHETGRKIVEMCRHWNMKVDEVKPLKKCWKGRDGKITHEELCKFTGLMGHTNQEGRDAALLAWVYAGLPLKL
jgi:hypothetical protein